MAKGQEISFFLFNDQETSIFPAGKSHWPSVKSTRLAHRLRLWPNIKTTLGQPFVFAEGGYSQTKFNPFKPEFTIVIFIHYKPRIAVAILDL